MFIQSLVDIFSFSHSDLLLNDGPPREGRRITISVFLTHPPDSKSAESKHQILIGALSVSGKTKWDMLDASVKRSFKEYCVRIDPATNLGLNTESVYCYQIGEIVRSKGAWSSSSCSPPVECIASEI